MPTLQEYVIRTVRKELTDYGIPNWLGSGTRKQTYPFVAFSVVAAKMYNYNFNKTKYQDILVQFNIYSKGSGEQDALDYASIIDDIFENATTNIVTVGYEINLCQQVSAIGPRYIGNNQYWETILQYKFVCSKSFMEWSSSSSSSLSSESSSSNSSSSYSSISSYSSGSSDSSASSLSTLSSGSSESTLSSESSEVV